MPIIYVRAAARDLADIGSFIASSGGDELAFLRRLRLRIEHHYEISNPGVAGRATGTREWLLRPLAYLAVVTWNAADVTIHRVLPTASITVPRGLFERTPDENAP